jgi:hypothetical protein
MKLLEKSIYTIIVFTVLYVLISVSLRVFEIGTLYNAHLIGGLVATGVSIFIFVLLIIKK